MNPREFLNVTGGIIGCGLVTILGFVTYALVFVAVPPANENALTLLIGILSANVGMVVAFYFGSSVQAKKQTETIDTLAKTAQTAGVALAPAPTVELAPGETATVKAEGE